MPMEVVRSFNIAEFDKAAKEAHKDYEVSGFDAEKLVFFTSNILLQEDDNFALFEYYDNGIYWGHYFFSSARGKDAVRLAAEMLKALKVHDPTTEAVYGCVPSDNKKAIWITRKLGFEYLYTMNTGLGAMQIYRMGMNNE